MSRTQVTLAKDGESAALRKQVPRWWLSPGNSFDGPAPVAYDWGFTIRVSRPPPPGSWRAFGPIRDNPMSQWLVERLVLMNTT